jgi:peptide/nickel transport system permease protein
MNTSSAWKIMWNEIRHDRLAFIGLVFFVVVTLGVYIWSIFIDQAAAEYVVLRYRDISPTWGGPWLGTDRSGRDMLMQLILSARNSFTIAFLITIGSSIIGIFVGLIAGFYAGHVDNSLMRIMDFIAMVPFIMLVIVFVTVFTNYTVVTFAVIFIAFGWMGTARLIRTMALRQGRLDYVSASKTLGTPNIVIIFREVAPNLVSIIVSNLTLTLAFNMGIETGLTFLGFGLPFGTPSLGRLIFHAQNMGNMTQRWWLWLPAALLIIFMMLSINFVGQALNRAADAKKRTV